MTATIPASYLSIPAAIGKTGKPIMEGSATQKGVQRVGRSINWLLSVKSNQVINMYWQVPWQWDGAAVQQNIPVKRYIWAPVTRTWDTWTIYILAMCDDAATASDVRITSSVATTDIAVPGAAWTWYTDTIAVDDALLWETIRLQLREDSTTIYLRALVISEEPLAALV
jgi:hypothetical protein